MTGKKRKRVWILGAGFSASLGAPLLNDLFSFRLREKLVAANVLVGNGEGSAERQQGHLQTLAYAFYHHGTGYPERYLFEPQCPTPRSEKGLWRHAEDYLEQLDMFELSASDGSVEQLSERFQSAVAYQRSRIGVDFSPWEATLVGREGRGWSTPTAVDLAREAKRIVAAECCYFLRKISSASERAKPYVRWIKWLGKRDSQDTIVTFNYDRVVEKLGAECTADVLVAGVGGDIENLMHRSKTLGSPLLVKLHGSVDWERVPEKQGFPFQQSTDPECAARSPAGQICTPGNSKMSASEREFRELWMLAQREIRDAHEVVFVGYRLPESDATAREMILDALESNENPTLKATIVLGPPCFDRERLSGLLRLAMPARKDAARFGTGKLLQVEMVDAWAQDYLQARRD